MIVWILLAVLMILFVVAVIFSSRNWYWWNILLVVTVFLSLGFFLALAAATLRTHQVWQSDYQRLERELQAEQASIDQKRSVLVQDTETRTDSLPLLNAALRRQLLDRGRVWRRLTPIEVQDDDSVVLRADDWGERLRAAAEPDLVEEPGAETDEQEETTAEPLGITEKTIVYLFQEIPLSELGKQRLDILMPGSELPLKDTEGYCTLPFSYLGEFTVTAIADDLVTLRPTLRLDEEQKRQIREKTGTWALYEMMPLDAYEVMAGLTQEQLTRLIPQDQTGLDDEPYAALISQYVRHQSPAQPEDPPERTWRRVKFAKSHQIDVDIEEESPSSETDFDTSGRARAAHLRLGEPVQFQPGDTALFDDQTARRLIGEGICEAEQEELVFVRELRDYESFFHQMVLGWETLEDQVAVVQRDTESLQGAHANATEQIRYRQQEVQKLQSDLEHFQFERDRIGEYLAALQDQVQEQLAQMSHLYRSNRRLAAQLARIQYQHLQDRGQGVTDQPRLKPVSGP